MERLDGVVFSMMDMPFVAVTVHKECSCQRARQRSEKMSDNSDESAKLKKMQEAI